MILEVLDQLGSDVFGQILNEMDVKFIKDVMTERLDHKLDKNQRR